MGRIIASLTIVIAVAAGMAVASSGARAEVIIGAGDAAEVHFHVARALCRAIELSGRETCDAQRIEGRHAAEPLAVLGEVRNGAIEIGIVQSDWAHHAFNGTGPVEFMDVSYENLRMLFMLHGEPFTVIARRDAGIAGLDDLAGKRINIGIPGSRQRVVMEQVMAAKGWTRDSFRLADELAGAEQSLALCHDRIQAMVTIVAHPDNELAKALELCNAEIVEIAGPAIDKLVGEQPYFSVTEIAGGTYESQPAAVRTFGVRVVVVVSEDMSDDDAYAVVAAVFEDLDRFKRLHPALGALEPANMIKDGSAAPLHPGAVRYFRENGVM